ncbi:MAG TPA: hypothetical protein VEJ36_07505 [Nitrososphaerales archaeon]|nr:hypothetical protein [Nitrososphaerales archaeon]
MKDFRSVRSSVAASEKALRAQLEQRERLLKESRDVISACSRSIIDVHNGRSTDAERELAAARSMLRSLKAIKPGQLSRYLVSPETEFVEASVVLSLVKGKEIPTLSSLSCSPEAYVLGLLDSVGELKRLVLDSLMKGRTSKARTYFEYMQQLYSLCSPMAVYDHVASGLRHKLDVARILVEDTRGLLAEESGREELTSTMSRMMRKLNAKHD